jgi:ATP-dependent Zn protease
VTANGFKIAPVALLRVATRTAFHEAGHATAALELDDLRDLILEVSLEPIIVRGQVETMGLAFSDPPRPENLLRLRTIEHALAVLMTAGAAGERRIYGNHSVSAAMGDVSMFYDLAIIMAQEARLAAISEPDQEATARNVTQRWSFVLRRGAQRADQIIARQFKVFQAITNELLAQGRISRDRLLALHERYTVAP